MHKDNDTICIPSKDDHQSMSAFYVSKCIYRKIAWAPRDHDQMVLSNKFLRDIPFIIALSHGENVSLNDIR